MPKPADPLLIGTYTETLPHVAGKGHGILGSSHRDGELAPPQHLVDAISPAWIVASEQGDRIYAVNETTGFDGTVGGGVSAYARDDTSGRLRLINAVSSGGVEPAHLALDPSGRFLVVANYRDGSLAVFALRPDGGIGERTDRVRHEGSGAHPLRQTSPHPHQVVFDPIDGGLLVPDLGIDAIARYELDDRGHLIRRAGWIELPAGAGPRHLAFAPDGSRFFLANELDSTLAVFDRARFGFERTQLVPTTKALDVPNSASELRVSPSGGSVLVSNRGAHSIAVFRVSESGSVEPVLEEPSGGAWPRSFSITADGGHVLVANQNSDNIVAFSFDEPRGTLERESAVAADSPVCVLVL